MAKQLEFGDYMKAKKGGASYEDYANMAKGMGAQCMSKADFDMRVAKGEDADADDKGGDSDPGAEAPGEDDADADEAAKARKSQVGVDDLMKSIRDYDAVEAATAQAGGSRESYLKARLDSGVITKSEMGELGRLWAGMTDTREQPLRKSMRDTIADTNEDAGALVDASEFLTGLVKSVDTSLERVEGEVARDGLATRTLLKAQGGLIKSMAAVIADQNAMIKSLAGRIEVVESTPAARRSVAANPRDVRERPLAKSATGAGPAKDPNALTKSQVHQGLRTLMQKAADARDEQAMDRISHQTALFESGGQLAPEMTAAIRHVI